MVNENFEKPNFVVKWKIIFLQLYILIIKFVLFDNFIVKKCKIALLKKFIVRKFHCKNISLLENFIVRKFHCKKISFQENFIVYPIFELQFRLVVYFLVVLQPPIRSNWVHFSLPSVMKYKVKIVNQRWEKIFILNMIYGTNQQTMFLFLRTIRVRRLQDRASVPVSRKVNEG